MFFSEAVRVHPLDCCKVCPAQVSHIDITTIANLADVANIVNIVDILTVAVAPKA